MLVRLFRKSTWHAPLLLIGLAVLLWLDMFFNPPALNVSDCSAPLFNILGRYWSQYPLGSAIFALLLLIAQAYYINYVATSNSFTDRYSALPGLIYILLMSSSPAMTSLNPILLANLFLIPAMNKLIDVYDEEQIARELFNSGLLIGLAGLFYYPALVLFLALIASVFVYYIVNTRRIAAALLGLITPFTFMISYYYLRDELLIWYNNLTIVFEPFRILEQETTFYQKIFIGGLGFFSILAFSHLQLVYKAAKPIRTRKRITLLFLFFLISVSSYLFSVNFVELHFGLLNITLSIALAVYFFDMRYRKLTEILFTVLVVLVLIGRFAGNFFNG